MIVLDANVLIAHLAAEVPYADDALRILDTEEELAIHPLTLAECLVHPARAGREEEAMRAVTRIGIEIADGIGDPLGLARLRARTALKMPDACVLQTAHDLDATLATFDARLATAAHGLGIAVVGMRPEST